jgi:hypothetical protein
MFKYTTFISHPKTVLFTVLLLENISFNSNNATETEIFSCISQGCKVSFDFCTCRCYFQISKYLICTFKISFSGALGNFSISVLCRTLAMYSIPYGIRWRDSTIRRRNISVASFSLLILPFSFIRISSYANASTCVTEYGRFLCTTK